MSTSSGNPIHPVVFGPPHRRLFGIHHAPAPSAPIRPAVLLCNAFGQEAVRAHRILRVLAERLARQGHAVLRFDYFGTGDSMGADLDGELDGWTGDLLEADRQLRSHSGAAQTLWIGMRLGGTVALRAARQAPEGLQRLVLWDPVLEGRQYLAHLRRRHVESLEEAFSLVPRPSPSERARNPAEFRDEAIGFALSPQLRAQLEALSAADAAWPARPASIVALTDPDDDDGRALAAALQAEPSRVRTVVVKHGTDWTTDSADNSALVPAQALMALMQASEAA